MQSLDNFTSYADFTPSVSPTVGLVDDAEETHDFHAYSSVLLNLTLIGCVLLAYFIKVNKIYYLPESAASMLVGVVIGGIMRLCVDDLYLFSFSPELFFFLLLPPIIFEAGYSLERKDFFDNIGAITLYAMLGTIVSTFIVGYLTFFSAKIGLITSIDKENSMEALLFGALISAVDPVATLSIMGNPELQCNKLLYSLVFGESVLNDAIAIVLFKTFHKYYHTDTTIVGGSQSAVLGMALLTFFTVTLLSILVGVGMGLIASFIFRHTSLKLFPKMETALLFLFCYLCYATAEAIDLSGIMALFFNGITLQHYNSYNLSSTAHLASEQIFASLAVVTETIVFLYMGMGVFTGKFDNWDVWFTILAMGFCLLGRAANIFPLSWLANRCRGKTNKITKNMQFVLWFAGLRGAIAFALAENMPGPNKDTYATATLSICLFTTIIGGGFTNRVLSENGMKQGIPNDESQEESDDNTVYDQLIQASPMVQNHLVTIRQGVKGIWKEVDSNYLQPFFGGSQNTTGNGEYELSRQYEVNDHSDDNGIVND